MPRLESHAPSLVESPPPLAPPPTSRTPRQDAATGSAHPACPPPTLDRPARDLLVGPSPLAPRASRCSGWGAPPWRMARRLPHLWRAAAPTAMRRWGSRHARRLPAGGTWRQSETVRDLPHLAAEMCPARACFTPWWCTVHTSAVPKPSSELGIRCVRCALLWGITCAPWCVTRRETRGEATRGAVCGTRRQTGSNRATVTLCSRETRYNGSAARGARRLSGEAGGVVAGGGGGDVGLGAGGTPLELAHERLGWGGGG